MGRCGVVIPVHGGCCHGEEGQSRWWWAVVAHLGVVCVRIGVVAKLQILVIFATILATSVAN